MKGVCIGLFVLVGAALLTLAIFTIGDDPPERNSTITTSETGNAGIVAARESSAVDASLAADQSGRDSSKQPDNYAISNTTEPEGIAAENHVETFLTTTELNTLHSHLLERFANGFQPEVDGSLPVNSLGLERAQRHQLYLEPGDQIILINNTPVYDLATNPAVGSMLAGPEMKLIVQRGDRVLAIDLSTY